MSEELIGEARVQEMGCIYAMVGNGRDFLALVSIMLRPAIYCNSSEQMDLGLSILRSCPQLRDIQVEDHTATIELEANDEEVNALLHKLVGEGVGLRSFGEKEPTLEDVFMLVTKGLVT